MEPGSRCTHAIRADSSRARLVTTPITQLILLLMLWLLALGGALCWVSTCWQVYSSSVERSDGKGQQYTLGLAMIQMVRPIVTRIV